MNARLVLSLVALSSLEVGAADFVIQNSNRPFKGFNDRTPVEPAGLNFATTRGGQAQLAFRAAGAIWGATLRSATPIVVDAAFATSSEDSAFSCDDPNRVVLGFARRMGSLSDPSFPKPSAAYPFALANALAGKNLIGTKAAILTRFNADLGTARCRGFDGWDFSLDENGLTLLSTLLHEFGHGLGFASSINSTTGMFSDGATAFDHQVWDVTGEPKSWLPGGPEVRKNLVTTPGGTVLTGPALQKDVPRFLGFAPALNLQFDSVDAGTLAYVSGAFSGTPEGGGTIALTNPADACADLAPGSLDGKYALIRRGDCTFVAKVNRAVDAGAIGVLMANNVDGLVQMAPSKPRRDLPAVMITQEAGNRIEAQLATGTASVSFVNGANRSNANDTGVYLYNPTTLEPGSSISHFNTGSYPRALLMQPVSEPSTVLNLDLTAAMMADLGWSVVNGLTVSVVKALEAPLTEGSEAKYLVAVINRRTTPIDSVTLSVAGPGSSSVLSYEGDCTGATCALGLMRSGDTMLIIATLKVGAGLTGPFDVTATLAPSSPDAEDNLSDTTSQEIASGGDLVVKVAPPDALVPESDAVFTTTVVNTGPSAATEVMATVSLVAADGTTLVLTGDCSGEPPCVLTQLGNGEIWEFTTTFAVPKGFNQKVTFSATVSSLTPDSNTVNNTAATSAAKGGCSSVSGPQASAWLAFLAFIALSRTRRTQGLLS